MNNVVAAIILSLIQGLTEFLPISSTGHLILAEKWVAFHDFPTQLFNSVTQLGSILALLSVYGNSLLFPLKTIRSNKQSAQFLLCVALATLPAVIFGLAFHSYIKTVLYGPAIIAISLIVGGVLFIRLGKGHHKILCSSPSLWQALCVGTAQAIALIPGVSRSGATIASGISVGLSLKAATEFSFILAIPTLCGATLYDILKYAPTFSSSRLPILLLGLCLSSTASFLVIRPFVRFIEKQGLAPFGWYRIVLGLGILWQLVQN